MGIGGPGLEAMVFDRGADGEMVEGLELVVCEAHEVVDRVVEEATDAGGPESVGFGFEVEDLADHAGFPVEMPVKVGGFFNAAPEVRDHPQGEGAISGNVLLTTHRCRFPHERAFLQQK